MNLNEIKSGRIGSYLPKKEGQLEIRCNDIELKQQIELVLHKMLKKMEINSVNNSYDWDSQDYKKFRQQLGNFPVAIFKKFNSLLLYYLDFSKEDLEVNLRNLDSKLDLHVFDDERNIRVVPEKVENENGIETIVKRNEYFYTKHIFNMGDLINFVNSLSSKKSTYEKIILSKYESSFDNNLSLDEQIDNIKSLLDGMRNNDSDMVDLITNKYLEFIDKASSDKFVYNFLKDKLPQIIDSNKASLANKLSLLEQQKAREIKGYIMSRNSVCLSVKANYEKRRNG